MSSSLLEKQKLTPEGQQGHPKKSHIDCFILKYSCDKECISEHWCDAVIAVLFKGIPGGKNICTNYRGISFLSVVRQV